jgi:hypothetical protein
MAGSQNKSVSPEKKLWDKFLGILGREKRPSKQAAS